jgi:hypothetical protein
MGDTGSAEAMGSIPIDSTNDYPHLAAFEQRPAERAAP